MSNIPIITPEKLAEYREGGEEWRPVVNYEGLYEISNLGRVKSLGRWRFRKDGRKSWYKECIRKPTLVKGYPCVMLCTHDKMKKMHYIHRLVAMAFIPNDDPVNKTTVNHKNEDKLDNRVENLEWMSVTDNTNYGTVRERIGAANRGKPSPLRGTKRPPHIGEAVRNALSKPIIQYDLSGKEVSRYKSVRAAGRENNFSPSEISFCCIGKRKQAYGFIWKYAKDVENA